MRTYVRQVEAALEAKDALAAAEALNSAESLLARAAQKGIVHKNAASRKISAYQAREGAGELKRPAGMSDLPARWLCIDPKSPYFDEAALAQRRRRSFQPKVGCKALPLLMRIAPFQGTKGALSTISHHLSGVRSEAVADEPPPPEDVDSAARTVRVEWDAEGGDVSGSAGVIRRLFNPIGRTHGSQTDGSTRLPLDQPEQHSALGFA